MHQRYKEALISLSEKDSIVFTCMELAKTFSVKTGRIKQPCIKDGLIKRFY